MDRLQKLAIGLTHVIYRNTAIEDMHSVKAQMDKKFYDDAYLYFKQMIDIADRNKDIYRMYMVDNSEELLTQKLKNPETTPDAKEIIAGIYFYSLNSEWDIPTLCSDEPTDDKTDYMLRGKFKEHCEKSSKLNDKVMCEINKDICNRIYTLLYKGYFN